MISLPSGTRIWLVAGATDMRKSFNGLGEQIQHVLDENPSPATCSSSVAAGVIPSKFSGQMRMDCASSPNALRLVNFCRGTWLYLPDQCQYGVRLTLTDLQPGGINHQMRDFTPGERFETDINRLCALADTGVIRAAQRNIHQCKMESIKPCAARRVSLNTRLMTRTVVMARSE